MEVSGPFTGASKHDLGNASAYGLTFKMDETCFTFSLAVDLYLAYLYVNWVEEEWTSGNKKPIINY